MVQNPRLVDFFPPNTLNISLHLLLACMVSEGKLNIILPLVF